jgi:hypothetical protein
MVTESYKIGTGKNAANDLPTMGRKTIIAEQEVSKKYENDLFFDRLWKMLWKFWPKEKQKSLL